ncbi:MAG: CDP-alcohol phosphatidyltransferase family protein [Clostridia bacterium]|nr:CDP-alcohol phosphatidyltransferase family protein [Clostridia bacterium]
MVAVVNALTALRLTLSFFVYSGIVNHQPFWLTLILCGVIGLSDWLDGRLARRFHAETRVGAVLDVAADLAFMILSYSALCQRGLLPAGVLVLVIYKFAEFCTTSYLASRGKNGKSVFISDPLGRAAAFLFYTLPAAVAMVQIVIPRFNSLLLLAYLCVLIPLVGLSSIRRIGWLLNQGPLGQKAIKPTIRALDQQQGL